MRRDRTTQLTVKERSMSMTDFQQQLPDQLKPCHAIAFLAAGLSGTIERGHPILFFFFFHMHTHQVEKK